MENLQLSFVLDHEYIVEQYLVWLHVQISPRGHLWY